MLASTPPEEKDKERRRWDCRAHGVVPVLIVAILLGLFAMGCAWMMITLIDHDKLRYCFASGRRNCAPEL
jgi:hypothetical protein